MFRFLHSPKPEECTCAVCGKRSIYISKALGVCAECIKSRPDEARQFAENSHQTSRDKFGLPAKPPRKNGKTGVKCTICGNLCEIPTEEKGFCGLRTNKKGKLSHLAGTPGKGILEWYYDMLPTNCVGDWVCPGGTGAGYPEFSYTDNKPEVGFKNLAVFYGACTFDCLFCQNWHYRHLTVARAPIVTAQKLAEQVDDKTSCVCFFGGDPAPQIMHALRASRLALDYNKNRVLRICWESNGSMCRAYLKKAAELSLSTGGCVKFDLKAKDENLNLALCGVSNRQTLSNFEFLGSYIENRAEPPVLIASTLLVPGYVEEDEVKEIAEFLSSINPDIPFSLLAFHPQFLMEDLPVTTKKQATTCKDAAERAGLKRVKIGNIHLLE